MWSLYFFFADPLLLFFLINKVLLWQLPSDHEKLLTCVFCLKPFQFISGLVIHLFSERPCYDRLLSKNGDKTGSKEIMLLEILGAGRVITTSLNCDQCGIEFQSQVAYLLHLDHHQLKRGHQIECKVCKQTFKSSCQFHRHNCRVGGKTSKMGCLICIKLDPDFQMKYNNITTTTICNEVGDGIDIKEEPIEILTNGDVDDCKCT